MQNKKNLRELPTTNILKNKKTENFYEIQNHKKTEGTTWNKQTKKQNFKKNSMKGRITAAWQQMGDKMHGAQKCFSCLMKIDRWDDEKQGLIAH